MLRRNQGFLTQLYIIADLICALVAFLFAYWLRFNSGMFEVLPSLPFTDYLIWGTIYAFGSILVGFYLQFYSPKRRKRFSLDVIKIIQIQAFSLVGLLSILYFVNESNISRQFLLIYVGINVIAKVLYRFTVKKVLNMLRKKGFNKRYVLILGAGRVGKSFYKNLKHYPEYGYDALGFLDDIKSEHDEGDQHLKPILGTLDELEFILNKHEIDEVIIALPLNAHSKLPKIINTCEKAGVKTLIIPDYFDLLPARPFLDNFAGIPLINVRDIPLDELSNKVLKRIFDIVFSFIAIILTSPVMLVAFIGIKLTSPGPVIFKQERMGLNRKNFYMYKFRSMHLSSDKVSDTQWTVENDPRRTKFGSFLRKTSIDELPQFFNVLLGHMSVVGPRPERPFFVDQFKEDIPKYMIKHQVRPGITGWAQVNGLRGDTSIEERISHDLYYIENWTFMMDIKIVWLTIFKGMINRNAY